MSFRDNKTSSILLKILPLSSIYKIPEKFQTTHRPNFSAKLSNKFPLKQGGLLKNKNLIYGTQRENLMMTTRPTDVQNKSCDGVESFRIHLLHERYLPAMHVVVFLRKWLLLDACFAQGRLKVSS